jgi:hypothetical protein
LRDPVKKSIIFFSFNKKFKENTNTCADYNCEAYYFYTLNDNKECVLSNNFRKVTAIIASLIIGMEFILIQLKRLLVEKVYETVEPL